MEPKLYIIGHTDLDGIARAAAIKAAVPEWRHARVIIRYSRKMPATVPATLPDALRTYIKDEVPEGSTVLVEDIPVDVRNPPKYVEALKEFCATRVCIWSDHHGTDKEYLQLVKEAVEPGGGRVIWPSESAYEYTLALVKELGGDVELAKEYAILAAIGDRDPVIVKKLSDKELTKWLLIGNGLDVMIREISAKHDPADYADLVEKLVVDPAYEVEAMELADKIPLPKVVTTLESGKVTIVPEELPPSWAPKSLEKAAIITKATYAIGVAKNPRDGTYAVRAITYWIAMAEDPSVVPVAKLPAFGEWLKAQGKVVYGPPAAPVVPGFSTFEEAMDAAKALAESINRYLGWGRTAKERTGQKNPL